tara:strand:+ start:1088 stop:1213 length:126 start_codon:yes stop_codon:yes gene_type:complete
MITIDDKLALKARHLIKYVIIILKLRNKKPLFLVLKIPEIN